MDILLATKTVNAFTAVEPTANIYEIQTARHGISFQERGLPVEVTIGDEAGIRARIHNQGTLPATLRTTMNLLDPDGDIAGSMYWEDEFAANEYIWYEQWFTLPSGGLWQVEIIVEFSVTVGTMVLDRATVGIRAAGGEIEESWLPDLKTVGIVGGLVGLFGLGLVLLAKRK